MNDGALSGSSRSAAQLDGIDFVSYSAAKRLLEWRDVIGCIADAYSLPVSEAEITPRAVARSNGIWLRCLPAIPSASGHYGAKLMGGAFAPAAGVRPKYVIFLFDRQTSRIAAFVDANLVAALRTAATSAVAFDRLAAAAPIRLGVLGSGFEAMTHVRAFAETQRIERLSVFSPIPEHRETCAADAATEWGIQSAAVDRAEAVVDGATVVRRRAFALRAAHPTWALAAPRYGRHILRVYDAGTTRDRRVGRLLLGPDNLRPDNLRRGRRSWA